MSEASVKSVNSRGLHENLSRKQNEQVEGTCIAFVKVYVSMFGVHYGFSYNFSSLLIRKQAVILAPSHYLLAGLMLQAWCGHRTHLHGGSTGGV